MTDDIHCIRCDRVLRNFMAANKGMQPSNGLAFLSYGHYGSTYFDPMDRTYIEISVCDQCLEDADRRGLVFHGRPALSREEVKP